jgi:hypothetical protein
MAVMAFSHAMEDKRLTHRLMSYWNRLRGELPLPQWQTFNVGALEDIWGQCCVWRVDIANFEKRTNNYTYEYIGDSAQEALGKDMTGMAFSSHFQKFPGARIVSRVDDVVAEAVPISDEGTFVNEKSKVVKYRSCLLPFGTKEGRVTHIVLGLSWKAF